MGSVVSIGVNQSSRYLNPENNSANAPFADTQKSLRTNRLSDTICVQRDC
jgi:hypothetical protein